MEGDRMFADGLMTVNEACAFARIGRTTIYGLMSGGQLSYVKIGAARRIPKGALVETLSTALQAGAERSTLTPAEDSAPRKRAEPQAGSPPAAEPEQSSSI